MDAKTFLDNFATIAEAPGGVKRLRNLVVDLAVCGRLVVQDPADEPAEDLLTSISRSKLVAESNLTEPVSAGDEPWSIPATWRWARLKQVSDFAAGRTPPTKDASLWSSTEGFHWVAIGDMPEGGEVTSTSRRVTDKAVAQIFGRAPDPPGTLLMSFKLTIGKVARLAVPAFHNEAIISITTPFDVMGEYLFRTLPLLTQGGSSKAAIMGNTLNKTSLTNLLIPVPPLAEQERIVAEVDELMGLCDELSARQERRQRATARFRGSALHALTEAESPKALRHAWERIGANWPSLTDHLDSIPALRMTVLQLAVRGALTEQDSSDQSVEELLAQIAEQQRILKAEGRLAGVRLPIAAPSLPAPPIPESWAWARLGSVLRHCRNGLATTPNDDGHGLPLLRISAGTSDPDGAADLTDHKFADIEAESASPYVVEPGDLLACRFNGNLHYVGRVAIVPEHSGTYLHPDKLIRIKAISINHRFLAIALNSVGTRAQIEAAASTTAGNIGINGAQLQALHIPIPPLSEQARIAEKVTDLLAMCTRLGRSLPGADLAAIRLGAGLADSLVSV